jgi:hypothetical protein
MAEPGTHTLRLLRGLRGAIQTVDGKVDALDQKLTDRIDNLARMIAGETVVGRYAAAGVDERLKALEDRLRHWKTGAESIQLNATFTELSGNSVPKQR